MQLATLIIAALALVLVMISMAVQLITLAVVFSSKNNPKPQQIDEIETQDAPTEEEINAFFGGYSVSEKKPSSNTVITPKEQRAVEEALTNVPTGIDEDFGL